MRNEKVLIAIVIVCGAAVAISANGCKSCRQEAAPAPGAQPAAPAVAGSAIALAAPASAVVAPEPVSPEVYPGPRSESLDGWRVTTGFSSIKDEQMTEPKAMDDTKVYLTVLDAGGHPVGQLEKLERAEMHLFLVAKDLRHAVYGHGTGPVREGADARAVTVRAPEGGDHALVAVFKPAGGAPRVVTSPVTVKGVLPEVMGPGLQSLDLKGKSDAETVLLVLDPAQAVAGQLVKLTAQDLQPSGQLRGDLRLPYVAIINDQLGWGDVVEWNPEGLATWTPRKAGDYLVLAPPTRGSKALAFRLHVTAAAAK